MCEKTANVSQSAAADAPSMPYVHNETLLELLMKQAQPGAGVGVRYKAGGWEGFGSVRVCNNPYFDGTLAMARLLQAVLSRQAA